MLKTARQEALLRFLKVDTFTPVDVLAQQLTVSPATTRRDLLELETQGLIERTWGGVRLVGEFDDPFQETLVQAGTAKRRIAEAAAKLVPDGATVILDIGTTVHYVALELRGRDVTVMTASLPTFEVLRNGGCSDLILLGGNWSEQYQCFTGLQVSDVLQNQSADIAFLGCSGILETGRIRDTSHSQSGIKRAIATASDQIYLLADATKFPGKGSSSPFGIGKLDGLITDAAKFSEQFTRQCQLNETEIQIV